MKKQAQPKPDLARGDEVEVREPNVKPWRGTVFTVKPSFSGWYVIVDKTLEGRTSTGALEEFKVEVTVPAERVRKVGSTRKKQR